MSISGGAAGLRVLLNRAVALDAQAVVRSQPAGQGLVDVFVTTPFDIIASRRCEGSLGTAKATYSAVDVIAALDGQALGAELPAAWPGALPPAEGFRELDRIPVDVVQQLAEQGRTLARDFQGPLGPPKSLLDQKVLDVSGTQASAQISMRAIFACTALGLIPGIGSHADIPRHLRVSKAGRWTRIDAPFGSVYEHKGLSLLV